MVKDKGAMDDEAINDSANDNSLCLNCKVLEEISPPIAKASEKASEKASAKKDKAEKDKDNTLGEFEADSKEAVPLWSKRVGNYSPYPKYLTCDNQYNLNRREDLVEIEGEIRGKAIQVNLDLGKDKGYAKVWVCAWASTSTNDPLKIVSPSQAYRSDENHGLRMTDEKGRVTFTLNCPQPYHIEGRTYCRHVHYVIEDRKEGIWMPMKTRHVMCQATIEEVDEALKEKTMMVINSLPKEYYEKKKIPKSLNLPRETLDKKNASEKRKIVTDFLKKHLPDYPPIEKAVGNKDLLLTDIPLIIYCMNDECKSASHLLRHLYEVGVNNVLEFSKGVDGWMEERILFDDDTLASEDSEDDLEDSDEDSDEDSEDDLDEDSEDEEKSDTEYEQLTFEGIEYLYDPKNNKVYNDELQEIGLAIMRGSKCKKIKWMKKRYKKRHERERDGEETDDEDEEEETDDEDEEPEEPEEEENEEEEPEEPEEEDSEEEDDLDDEDEEEEEPEEEEDEEEEESEEDEDDSITAEEVEKGIYDYNEDDLQQMNMTQLRSLVKELNGRKKTTIMYPLGSKGLKTKEEMIGLILGCQGKPTKVKSNYRFLDASDLRKKKVPELKYIVKQMTDREPEEFKTTCSRWSKGTLIGYIMSCRGQPIRKDQNKEKKDRSSQKKQVGRGWGYGF